MTPEIQAVLEGKSEGCVVTGDCLEVMADMPDGCVDAVITDPPYEKEAHTLQRRVKRFESEPLSFEPLSFEVRTNAGQHIARLVKTWVLVFCQVEATEMWRIALEPLTYKRTCVWIKPDAMPQYSGDRPGMGYESIVCCHAQGRSRWNGGGRCGVFVHNKNSGGKHLHETQKPLGLLNELVELFSEPGDVILDPFCGSGTTCVAAKKLGRRFIGIEISPEYCEIARQRLQAVETGVPVKERRAGQMSLFDKE